MRTARPLMYTELQDKVCAKTAITKHRLALREMDALIVCDFFPSLREQPPPKSPSVINGTAIPSKELRQTSDT
jgi:hypothetical protein